MTNGQQTPGVAGPVIIAVEVDYHDNYRFMEIMHPDVLDR
jgi:hypothetical protein